LIRSRTYRKLSKPQLMEDPVTKTTMSYKTCYYQDGDMSEPYGYWTGDPMSGILWF